jgi:hypothetical protein
VLGNFVITLIHLELKTTKIAGKHMNGG